MRGRDIAIVLVCIALSVGLLIAAGTQLDYINAQREAMNLTINAPLENAPPALAFATVAMGAFRGLVVDILWMRADKLKEEGQFFDARQLAEWITTLQPRFAAVWEFHAWNMAYNISVAIPATQPEQRWRWVKNGYELLRDKGIPLNPKSIQLYRELGRIFQHKMGGVSDDVHKYYKLQFAAAIGPLLQSEDNALGQESNAYFEALIRAPQTWQAVRDDPNVSPFIETLQKADETFANEGAFVRNYLALRQNPPRFKAEAFKVIDAFRGTETIRRFDLFAKAWQLRNEWKLDPAMMHEVNKMYGPIDLSDPNTRFPMDWRHPDSHAIYWAVKALQVEARKENREVDMHETNVDRIIVHSLQNLFRYGKIMILEGPVELPDETGVSTESARYMRRDIFLGQDLRMLDSYNKASLAAIEKHRIAQGREGGALETLRNGHRNMLRNAVMSFYQSGVKGYALRLYNQLRQLYPDNPDFHVSLEQFVRNRFHEELDSIAIHDAAEQIVSVLSEGYYQYAIRDDDAAAARDKTAQDIYDYYMDKYQPEERIDLPPMRMLKWFAADQFLRNEAFPPYVRQGLLSRMKVEQPKLYEQWEQTAMELQRQIERQQQQETRQ